MRTTLAGRLFLSIFLSFLGLGALITGILVWDVLQRAGQEVAREVQLVKSAFHDPIADQLWAYDEKELNAVLDAMVHLSPVIRGVTIFDPPSGRRLAGRGEVSATGEPDELTDRFEVYYLPQGSDAPRLLGDTVLHIPAGLALQRSWPSIALILIAAAVKVVLVWLLFQYFARRQLVRPLADLTAAVDAVDLSADRGALILAVGEESGELARLQDAFNRLLTRLDHASAERDEYERELVAARDRLEEAVAQRTVALEEERRRAEDASLAKSRFLAMMSHALRTPLNSILGFSRMMSDETLGRMSIPKYREYNEDIHGSAQHLLEVINDILDISKIETGETVLEETEVDLREVALAAVRLVRPQIEAHKLTLGVDVPPGKLRLHADARAIRQVIVNLLSNAIKFTAEGGSVSISAHRGNLGEIEFSVEDTGIGIASEDIPRVLEALGQSRTNPDTAHEGTGLRLTLSKQLVELHGGHLTLESQVGQGTRVTVTLPAQRTLQPA